jgi:hypothetical protein
MGGKARVGLSTGIHRALETSRVLDQHRGGSVVIGGIAVIARGVPRVTRDVDVAFSGAEVSLSGFLTDLDAQRASSRGSMTPLGPGMARGVSAEDDPECAGGCRLRQISHREEPR